MEEVYESVIQKCEEDFAKIKETMLAVGEDWGYGVIGTAFEMKEYLEGCVDTEDYTEDDKQLFEILDRQERPLSFLYHEGWCKVDDHFGEDMDNVLYRIKTVYGGSAK